MPVTQITLLKGYAPADQARLVARVSDAVRSVIPAAESGTTTFVQEVSTYRRDAQIRSGGDGQPTLPDALAVVQAYLEAMQARHLDAAQAHLAPGFVMVFPGGKTMTALAELMDWARQRYQRVSKSDVRWEQSWQGDTTVVYARCVLNGVWPDGQVFSAIRFIDRFEVHQGLIVRQEVWNDLAEHRQA